MKRIEEKNKWEKGEIRREIFQTPFTPFSSWFFIRSFSTVSHGLFRFQSYPLLLHRPGIPFLAPWRALDFNSKSGRRQARGFTLYGRGAKRLIVILHPSYWKLDCIVRANSNEREKYHIYLSNRKKVVLNKENNRKSVYVCVSVCVFQFDEF